MPKPPITLQDLIKEFEESKQSRIRAWDALQKIPATLSDLDNVAIAPPKRKTFEDEGALLDRTLAKALRERNKAIKELMVAAKELDKAVLGSDKTMIGPAHQAMPKALGNAEDLL
jgi:hypothetical protein